MGMIKKFFNDESGATMVEYAILVALIAVAAIVIIGVLGGQINDAFTAVSNQLAAQVGTGG
ncbi:MAG: Flp family type IVb pilin [Thiomicrorhabdus sp.]|nr:Flp family type IVb pilin [Thiomicrorhabdus sp.]